MVAHANTEAISAHVEKHIGKIHQVFHEIFSDDIHLDILHVKSTLFRRYEVLVTAGMSALPMRVPDGESISTYAELAVVLPKGWPLTKTDFMDERYYWPIRMLKDIAREIHHAKSYIGYGHTIAFPTENGDLKPYAESTELCAAAILPPLTLTEDFLQLSLSGNPDEDIFFWTVVPLHQQELAYKIESGLDALLDHFDDANVTDRIDPARPSIL